MPNIFAVQFPTYLPAMRIITAITQADPVVITTSFANDYVNGEIVRISVPQRHGMYPWGMSQIDGLTGVVTLLSNTQFSLPIDSSGFDAFVTPVSPTQRPYVVPIAELNSILSAATRNVL